MASEAPLEERLEAAARGHVGSAAGHGERRLWLVVGLTGTYLVVEVLGGWLTGSLALLADAGHMFTDVVGLGLALAAIRLARRPPTPRRTYGFYRAEILGALANSLLLFAMAGYVLFEAWHRLQAPPDVHSIPMLLVAAGGLVVNLSGMALLRAGAQESLNLRGAYLELFSDLLGSLGAIVAAVVIAVTGWSLVDPLVSLGIGLFILPRTWRLLMGAVDILLEATPAHVPVAEVEAAMRRIAGVHSIHDLHIWTITSGFVALSSHVLATGRSADSVLHDLRQLLHDQFGIAHVTLQIESPDHADDGTCCTLDALCPAVDRQTLPAGHLHAPH